MTTKSDKERSTKNKRLLKTYGITIEEFEDNAKNGCEICGVKVGRLCQDHIHQKGFKKLAPEEKRKYCRGVLCFLCNTGLKGFERTIDGVRNRKQLEGTVKYFKKYKLKGEI